MSRRTLRQPDLFVQPEARRAAPPVVCLFCGADVSQGEPHSLACDEAHGRYCPPWDGHDDDDDE